MRSVAVRSANSHANKRRHQMAARSTSTWGVLLGLVVLPGAALANQDVIKLTGDSKNWAMQAGNMQNHRYSQLKQINKDNVKNLPRRVAVLDRRPARPRRRPAGDRRHAVRPQPVPEQGLRDRPRRPADQVEVRAEAGSDRDPGDVLRHGEPRRRLRRGQDLPAAGRHHSRGARRQDRQGAVEGQDTAIPRRAKRTPTPRTSSRTR